MKNALGLFFGCLLLTQGAQLLAQGSDAFADIPDDAFAGLPYDEAEVRRTIERYSVRIEGKAGSAEIPGSVGYGIFLQNLLSDPQPGFVILEQDLLILRNLAVASTGGIAGKHDDALREICGRVAQSDGPADSTIELATAVDQSRDENEQELDRYFAQMLRNLTPEIARIVESKWMEFSANTDLVYTSFDMSGFAQEMPEAAQVMLTNGCTKFPEATAQP